jgi:hypothetical protein
MIQAPGAQPAEPGGASAAQLSRPQARRWPLSPACSIQPAKTPLLAQQSPVCTRPSAAHAPVAGQPPAQPTPVATCGMCRRRRRPP